MMPFAGGGVVGVVGMLAMANGLAAAGSPRCRAAPREAGVWAVSVAGKRGARQPLPARAKGGSAGVQ